MDNSEVSQETQETIDMMRNFVANSAITGNPTRNKERAAKSLKAYTDDGTQDLQQWKRYIIEQWRSGAFADAAMTQQRSFPDGKVTKENLVPTSVMVYELLAMAYFRVGLDFNPQPIILPVNDDQIHGDPQYVDAALQVLQLMVDKFPDQTDLQWYLNLCHMLIGTYPAGVPSDYMIDLAYLQEVDTPVDFVEVSSDRGIKEYSIGGGAVWLDIDGDQDQDLMTMSHDLDDSITVYRNDGSEMVDVTASSGIQGLPGGYIASPADMDNDGDIDVFIGRGRGQMPLGSMPVSLLRNNGDGTFDEVGRSSGMNVPLPVASADWVDYDNDGWLDLYIQTEATNASPMPVLYHNLQDGTYEDEAFDIFGKSYVGVGASSAFIPVNDDNHIDHVSSFADRVQVLQGLTGEPFRYVPAIFDTLDLVSNVVPFDIDSDGDLDLLLTTHLRKEPSAEEIKPKSASTLQCRLFVNDGKGNFSPAHNRLGRLQQVANVESVAVIDIDLDGDQDLYLSVGGRDMTAYLPNRLFINDGGAMIDATWSAGLGVLTPTAGVAVANIDGDPYPEIYLSGGGYYAGDRASSVLFDASADPATESLKVSLRGTVSNRQGIGSKITITGKDEDGQVMNVYRWVDNGYTMVTQQTDLPIGLGRMQAVDRITVVWPDGHIQEVDPRTVMDNHVLVVEDR